MLEAQMAMGADGEIDMDKLAEAFASQDAVAAAAAAGGGGGGGGPAAAAAAAAPAGDAGDAPVVRADSLQADINALYGNAKVIRQFAVIHYNGLEDRGRKPMCVLATILQTDNGIVLPAEIADTTAGGRAASGGGAGAAGAATVKPADANIFEDVVRTKWRGCSVRYDQHVAPKLN
jgi:hypothetical protein